MKRMTDERLAEFGGIHLDSEGYARELLQALKVERQHAGLLDDSRLGAEHRITELELTFSHAFVPNDDNHQTCRICSERVASKLHTLGEF